VFILCAEFGTFYFLKKILEHLELSKSKALVYLLNPLVILELSGNLHFEGVMLFFITASIYYLLINNLLYSASLFSLAVSTKMIPLILLPIFVKSVGFKKGFIYSAIVAVLSVVLFLPFINQQLITNIGNSVGLYFQKFEFNASFYYLFRWLGFQFSGYNEIAIIGKVLPIVSLILILIISLKDFVKEINSAFFQKVLLILFVYYLFSLIIHPWYVTFLVLISVFLKSRFAIIWSILIFGSYLAYSTLPYKENMVIVWIEYSVVLAWYYCEKKGLKFTQIFN
jgi:alpha-1,6-mannosyltransferase